MKDFSDFSSKDIFEGLDLAIPTSTPGENGSPVTDKIVVCIPKRTSPEWNDYVLSLFEENEMFEGRPLCAGLRRVAELVMGPIMISRPTQVFPPKESDGVGRATVVWEVVFETGHLFSDVADCWEGNTDDAFCVFNTATAATRAEGRALRKALGLKTVAAEEMTNKNTTSVAKELSIKKNTSTEGEYDESQRMTDAQANFIDVKAKQLDINVAAFFKQVFSINVNRKIDKRQASAAIERLNEYQQDKTLIPTIPSIKGYQNDWRSTVR
jgi:hypothetical protein